MERKEKSFSKYLYAYCMYPSLSFETQGSEEKVILILRAHPITQLFWILNVFIFIFIFAVFNIYVLAILPFNSLQGFFINIVGMVFIFSYAFFNFLSWFFNVGIITNKRVVDIDFHNVLYKELSEARLPKIEDITSKSGGYIGSLFNFGNVFVQTAGQEINIEFIKVPNPSGVLNILNHLLENKHGH